MRAYTFFKYNTLNIHPEGFYDNLIIDYDHETTIEVDGPVLYENSFHDAYKFDGISSYGLVADADWDGTGGKLVCGWFFAQSYGEGVTYSRVFDGGAFNMTIESTLTAPNYSINFQRVATVESAENSISLNKWIFFAIITESDGNTNIYIGDEDIDPVLSGTADQDAGTPADGDDLYLGNGSGNDKTFEGAIHGLRIWDLDKITMSPEDLLQLYYKIYTK